MKRKKILLVEDSALPRQVAQELLESLNYQVDIAITGEDGVALCQKNHYDLIFLDIDLPGIDGVMTARLIREQENRRQTPIVALTANTDPAVKVRALSAGMDDYLTKPLTFPLAEQILLKYCNSASKKHCFV